MADEPQTSTRGPDDHYTSDYRAIILTNGGDVISTRRISALDDETAAVEALRFANGRAVELWDGLRFIEHFDALTD